MLCVFVRVGGDLEQEAAAFLVGRDVSEFVDDQEPGPADLGELPVEPVLRVGAQQSHDELGDGEEPGRHALQAGLTGQRDREMRLAGAGWSEHDHVLRALDEVEALKGLPPVVDGEAQGCPVVAVEHELPSARAWPSPIGRPIPGGSAAAGGRVP